MDAKNHVFYEKKCFEDFMNLFCSRTIKAKCGVFDRTIICHYFICQLPYFELILSKLFMIFVFIVFIVLF